MLSRSVFDCDVIKLLDDDLSILIYLCVCVYYRKTQVGNIDIVQIRPPRFIARDGAVSPFSPAKAIGNALLVVHEHMGVMECVYLPD